ncbi:MAG TPA: IPT/TIG domain-containing protein, partial [Verrucomicrobiae bacterium]
MFAVTAPLSAQIITNVTPPLGGHGDFIRIFGNGFAPGNHRPNTLSIDFNGTLSTTSTNQVASDSEIDITNVPTTATSGYIHAFLNGVEAISPQPFVVVPTNMPYATNFSPLYGANNTTVTITGVHFVSGGPTNATFNGVISKTVTGVSPFVQSDNSMIVTAPSGVTSGPLVLISKLGATHNFSTANNVISTATNFFVQPAITSFSPASGRPNTNVVITGVNLTAASGVAFGSASALSFTVVNNNTINAFVPTNASTAAIVVSPPNGTILAPASSATSFKMLPTIFSFSPSAGAAGTVITISGAGLNEKSPHPDVTVGGGTVVTFGTISPNTLSFNVPSTATSGLITVTTTNGSIASTQNFYLPASITSFTPIGGPAGIVVKITGVNFTNASAVSFNGLPAASFAVTNNTIVGAIAPSGVTSGPISITTPFGTTNSVALFFAPPTITSFTPTHGLPGTNVTITGTSFTNATAVLFNGTPAASFVVSNNTTLSAVVPANATTGPITVQAPGGTNSSAANFTIDSADLAISMTGVPNPVFVGSNLLYTIVITNTGPFSALNVRLTNTLPSSVVLKTATTSQG